MNVKQLLPQHRITHSRIARLEGLGAAWAEVGELLEWQLSPFKHVIRANVDELQILRLPTDLNFLS